MEISLRSQMAAGIAVAGAAAIAVTPIVNPQVVPSLERVAANVEMTAWSNPLTALAGSLGSLATYTTGTLFGYYGEAVQSGFYEGADIETFYGFIPQILNGLSVFPPEDDGFSLTGLPLLSALATNLSGYITNTLYTLADVSVGVGGVLFGVPLTAVEVITGLISGTPVDIAAAIETNIVAPITTAFESVVGLVSGLAENVLANATTVLTSLPQAVIAVVNQVVGGLTYVGTQFLDTVTTAIGQITNPNAAWNTLVDGLLGPDGVLGSAIELSVGQGFFVDGQPPTVYPSLRQVLTATNVTLALGIENLPVPGPVAAARTAAPAAAAPAAAALAESAPAAAAPAELSAADVKADDAPAPVAVEAAAPSAGSSDNGAGESATAADDAPTPKAASKQRVSRKAS